MDGTPVCEGFQQSAFSWGQQQRQAHTVQPQWLSGELSGEQCRRRPQPQPAHRQQQHPEQLKRSMQGSSAPTQQGCWQRSPAAMPSPGQDGAVTQGRPGTVPPPPFAARQLPPAAACAGPPSRGSAQPLGNLPRPDSLPSLGSLPPLPITIPSAQLHVNAAFLAPAWPRQQGVAQGSRGQAAQARSPQQPQESCTPTPRGPACPPPLHQGAPGPEGCGQMLPSQQPSAGGSGLWHPWTAVDADDQQMEDMLDMARELGLLPECSSGSAGQHAALPCLGAPSWVPRLACDEPSTPPSRRQLGHSARHELVSDTAGSGGEGRRSASQSRSQSDGHCEERQQQQGEQQQQQPQPQPVPLPWDTAPPAGPGCGAAWPQGVPMPTDLPQLWQPLPQPPRLNFPSLLPAAREGGSDVAGQQAQQVGEAEAAAPLVSRQLWPATLPSPQQGKHPSAAQQPAQQQGKHPSAQPPPVQQQQGKHPSVPPPPAQQPAPPQAPQDQPLSKHLKKRKWAQPEQPASEPRPLKNRCCEQPRADRQQQQASAPLQQCDARGAETVGTALLAELRRQFAARQQAEAEAWHREQRRLLEAAQTEQRRQLELAQQQQLQHLERAQKLLQARQAAQQQAAAAAVAMPAAKVVSAPLLVRQLSQPQQQQQRQQPSPQQQLALSHAALLPQPVQALPPSPAKQHRSFEAAAFVRSMSLMQGQL